jgi:hypothetical protein
MLKVHDPEAEMVAPERLTEFDPAVAVMVPPPHDPVSPFGVAMVKPLGNVSVKAVPLSAVAAFAFEIVKLKLDVLPAGTLDGVNDWVIEGRATTVKPADAVLPVPSFVEVMALVVLLYAPAALTTTFTLNVQELPAARVAPESVTLPVPAIAVIVPPPHDPVNPFGVDTVMPDGSVSVNASPVAAVELSVFVTVKLNWLV